MTTRDRYSKTPVAPPGPAADPNKRTEKSAWRRSVRITDVTAERADTGLSIIGGRYAGQPTTTRASKTSKEG